MTPGTHKRSALYMLAHDEWCSHDETDDGIPCDCHLSVIATLRARLEQMERALADRDRRIDEGDAIPASFYKRLEAAERQRDALNGATKGNDCGNERRRRRLSQRDRGQASCHPRRGGEAMTPTPGTLVLLLRSAKSSSEVDAIIHAAADAWEEEQNEDIRRHEEWLNERNGLLERLEAAEAENLMLRVNARPVAALAGEDWAEQGPAGPRPDWWPAALAGEEKP